MDRYIGLDAHASSCTVATVGPSGRRLHSQVAETNAGALIRVLRGIGGSRHLCLEEGTHASWLYEVLSPHVKEIVVAGVSESRGPKSDKLDAFGLAEQLRIGAIKRKVHPCSRLRQGPLLELRLRLPGGVFLQGPGGLPLLQRQGEGFILHLVTSLECKLSGFRCDSGPCGCASSAGRPRAARKDTGSCSCRDRL